MTSSCKDLNGMHRSAYGHVPHLWRYQETASARVTDLLLFVWLTPCCVPLQRPNYPLKQAYQGGQAQADSRELMGSFALTVAYTYRSLQITDAVRERGRRMAILVCLPDYAAQ